MMDQSHAQRTNIEMTLDQKFHSTDLHARSFTLHCLGPSNNIPSVYRFFCPDWTVGGQNNSKNKGRSCVLIFNNLMIIIWLFNL